MKNDKEKLLFGSLEQLPLSQDCITNLKNMQIDNLQDFVSIGWQGLREKKDFNYINFNEVIRFLTDHSFIHLMENSQLTENGSLYNAR